MQKKHVSIGIFKKTKKDKNIKSYPHPKTAKIRYSSTWKCGNVNCVEKQELEK